MAHLARGLALLLGKDDLDDTALEFTAIHAVLGVVRLVHVGEFDEGEWLWAPAATRKGRGGGRGAVSAGIKMGFVSVVVLILHTCSLTCPTEARTSHVPKRVHRVSGKAHAAIVRIVTEI